jgi:hypothetical protein
MLALALILFAFGAILIHSALSGKSLTELFSSGLPSGLTGSKS